MPSAFVPSAAPPSAQGNPLAPLSAEEFTRAAAACKHHAATLGLHKLIFNTVTLKEPAKADLVQYLQGTGPCPERLAFCILIAPPRYYPYEALVKLQEGNDAVVSWVALEGVHPTTHPEENCDAEEIIKADPKVAALIKERYGFTDADMQFVLFDPWAIHNVPPQFRHRRVMQGFLYFKNGDMADNEYAHPLDMVVIVDTITREVLQVEMYDKPAKLPLLDVNYHRDRMQQAFRTDVKPLYLVQPEGPSFTVDGSRVSWQKWELSVGFDTREGLILHTVGYRDGGRLRPLLHRASLAEMAVPYGDPSAPYTRKCALDLGDYGLGLSANSLALGCDCLGHIHYFDAWVNDQAGGAVLVKNAICMHEEDEGLLWKHTDVRTMHVEVRRSRKLVISMVATFKNYEYCFYWNLYQDGSIKFDAKLTGILSTSPMPDNLHTTREGTVVAPLVNAVNHQHFFCMRLDFAVDDPNGGKDLIVSEVEAAPIDFGPLNPEGNGFKAVERELLTVKAAMRDAAPELTRHWKIKNPKSFNPVTGEPVAYKLFPAAPSPLMARPGSSIYDKCFFCTKALFVTPHDDEQRFPAGRHVVGMERCQGLAEWTKEDRPLVGADPVVWYTFGITHMPRIEDFPIMPVDMLSFWLKPHGFFAWNPSLDVPPSKGVGLSKQVNAAADGGGVGGCCGGGSGGAGACQKEQTAAAAAAVVEGAAAAAPLQSKL